MPEAGNQLPYPEQPTVDQEPALDTLQVLNGELARCCERTGYGTIDEMRANEPNLAYTAQVESTWRTVKKTGESFIDVIGHIIELSDDDRERFRNLGRDTPAGERNSEMLYFAEAHPELSVNDDRMPPIISSTTLDQDPK